MSCINKVTANIAYDCSTSNRAKGGLESKAVLINTIDIDRTALTQSGGTVTNLTLKSGSTGFEIGFIKQLGNTAAEFTINDGLDSFKQSFACRVFGQSSADAERIKELSQGEFVMVVETKFKGTNNVDAYKVFGIDNGLKMSEGTFSSIENDGSFVFKLSSVDGFGEEYAYKTYLEGTYAATKAKFEGLFS
ncbi:hypothetical protein [Flavobacterium hibernum]|uniref:Uncharacterized protein n=1 Tax=Flavobacterium hibernum TaxID=37752 RepID=A0A0D0ERX9_9FLAO|nr:hypothetical protein [Flavobacterium hibernum]KIO50948.1 hypothetical protein IW18_20385 [Flavobacterium hibernum]OXA85189.1 hypothetical protein B0A73_17725 [Flavobacterium hibernum]STO19567.1 Uncharacterised protein [Flavobacterium hibernum]